MANVTIGLALGPATRGTPMTSANVTALSTAINGAGDTSDFFHQQWQLNGFYKALNQEGDWPIQSDANGNPVCTMQGADGASLTVQPAMNAAVILGQTAPQTFQNDINASYNIVGMLTVTVAYQEQPLWYIEAPLGVIDSVAISQLAGLAWTNLLQPVMQSFVGSIRQCLSASVEAESQDAVATAAADAADAAAIEAETVGEVVISLELGVASIIGIALLIALPFILALIFHTSYHNLKIYNLTNFDLLWGDRISEGTMSSYPVGTLYATQPDYVIPAMRSWAPPGLVAVPVATEADFSFVSDSQETGIAYVMGFALVLPGTNQPVSNDVSAQISVPLAGDNRIYIGEQAPPLAAYALQCELPADNNAVLATVTMDALTGK